MISDFQLLGIEETLDIAVIKKAYRSRVKQLHPDTTENEKLINNHFLLVEVCKAYQRLLSAAPKDRQAGVKRDAPSRSVPVSAVSRAGMSPSATNRAVAKHVDPAYAYYKSGITIFNKIHPNEWKKEERSVIATEIGTDEKEQREAQQRVIDLVSLFPKAYYYFSVVANEYPESVWAADSIEKMKLIEARMIRYKKIIESFSSWKECLADEKKRYEAMLSWKR